MFKQYRRTLLLLVTLVFAPQVHAGVAIDVNFGSGLTSSQQAIFSTAAAYWQSVIVDYIGGGNPLTASNVDDADGRIDITASGVAIDGVNGVLGSAGPTNAVGSGGYLYASQGIMSFDVADLSLLESSGALLPVIMHEMGHVLGLGTLWDPVYSFNSAATGFQDVYDQSNNQYTGANALSEWQSEFGQTADTFVPVEDTGGAGTAGGHWNEVHLGASPTGITDGSGRDLQNELMTGWLNSPVFLSRMTVASFADIGYVVDYSNLATINSNINNYTAVPEPSTLALVVFGSVVGIVGRRRNRPAR